MEVIVGGDGGYRLWKQSIEKALAGVGRRELGE